jgi:carboxypeptidase family protein
MKSPSGGFSGRRVHCRIIALGILICVLGCSGFAQQTAATLVGAATDTTGAVLPKVSIRAINLATNISRESTTDDSGNYSIPFLPAGDYSVTAVLSGFRESKVEQITLQVLQTARVEFRAEFFNLFNHYNPDRRPWIQASIRQPLARLAEAFRESRRA